MKKRDRKHCPLFAGFRNECTDCHTLLDGPVSISRDRQRIVAGFKDTTTTTETGS
jgi:hypothetical protein